MSVRHISERRKQRGFMLGYVMLGLALTSLSLMALARMGGKSADSKRMAEMRDEVVTQANLIRAKLIACTVSFPGGDNGLGFRPQLPNTPASGVVDDVACPGNPNANKSIWAPAQGIHAPRRLSGLGAWHYTHDAMSARISISTAAGGGNVSQAALNNAALKFGTQSTVTGNTLTVVIAN